MKRSFGFLLCLLFVATSAHAMLPPAGVVYNLLKSTIGASPCVTLGDSGGDIVVTTCNDEVASALGVVLKRSYGPVAIRVLDSTLHEVSATIKPGPDPVATIKAQFQTALSDNPLFSSVLDGSASIIPTRDLWIEMQKEVVQYFIENLGVPGGNVNKVAAVAFSEAFRHTFFNGAVKVGWATVDETP